MAGLAPKLPLRIDDTDGYALIKSYEELARQNLKMLVLTIPGERIMDPNFGVGLKKYLFEPASPGLYGNIEGRIRSQVNNYLPYIKVLKVKFQAPQGGDLVDSQLLSVEIKFLIAPLKVKSTLLLDLEWKLNSLRLR